MQRHGAKEKWPEQNHPGDEEPEFGLPGSIEQQLDMCESGTLRGDEIQFSHGLPPEEDATDRDPIPADYLMDRRYEIDLAEENREGDEMSGDEHSCGLQGGESELAGQPHINSGLPGDRTLHEDLLARTGTVPWEEEELP